MNDRSVPLAALSVIVWLSSAGGLGARLGGP